MARQHYNLVLIIHVQNSNYPGRKDFLQDNLFSQYTISYLNDMAYFKYIVLLRYGWIWAPFQYSIRWLFILSYRCEIWQARQQQCCQGACQISERSDYSKYKSRSIETSRDLMIRCLIGYWETRPWFIEKSLWITSIQCFHYDFYKTICRNMKWLLKLP